MNRFARYLIRLYPASWRSRYGDEFEALIEDSSPDIRSAFDLMKGAINMHLKVRSFLKLAPLLSIAGFLVGLVASVLVTPLYVSTATLLFEATPGFPQTPPGAHLSEFEPQVLNRNSLSSVIRKLNLYPEERAKRSLDDVIGRMRTRDIQIRTVSMGSIAFTISFTYRDRQKAQEALNLIIPKFVEATLTRQLAATDTSQFDRIEARLSAVERRLGIASPGPPSLQISATPVTTVEVLDPPSLPAKAVSPNRPRFMLCGLAAGLGAAAVIAIFRRRVPPALASPAATA